MLVFHSKVILAFTLILMTCVISVANQNYGMVSAEWVALESKKLEEDRRMWIEEILEADINPNFTDEDGNTPLMVAVKYALSSNSNSNDWFEIVIALLEAGADPALPSFQRGFLGNTTTTPLIEAMNSSNDHRVTIALIEARSKLAQTSSFVNDNNRKVHYNADGGF